MSRIPRPAGSRAARAADERAEQILRAAPRSMSLPARLGISAGCGVTAALVLGFGVRAARWFGVRPETIAGSLALRIGLPAAGFVIVFLFVCWSSGRTVEEPEISEEMSDAEIAKALKKRSW